MGSFISALDPVRVYRDLIEFLEVGGPVLVVIMGATFFLWILIVERYWFFWTTWRAQARRIVSEWRGRTDHQSWNAHKIREQLISEVRSAANSNLGMIKTLVAAAPMFGLLGTVTGMVEVFDVMALTGSSNARAMASGVSRATIPTMAGMVVSLSGLYFSAQLDIKARREVESVADKLELK